jgi:hypothetical protein
LLEKADDGETALGSDVMSAALEGSGRKAFRLVRKAPSLAGKPRNLARKAFCLARKAFCLAREDEVACCWTATGWCSGASAGALAATVARSGRGLPRREARSELRGGRFVALASGESSRSRDRVVSST